MILITINVIFQGIIYLTSISIKVNANLLTKVAVKGSQVIICSFCLIFWNELYYWNQCKQSFNVIIETKKIIAIAVKYQLGIFARFSPSMSFQVKCTCVHKSADSVIVCISTLYKYSSKVVLQYLPTSWPSEFYIIYTMLCHGCHETTCQWLLWCLSLEWISLKHRHNKLVKP